jgi:hypothetical protein
MTGITKIYLITNIDNDPNKVYIGKTKNNSRENDHKFKFGSQITFTYIDEINSLDRKDWTPLESYWIEQFRQWGFIIMNPNKKGGGGPEYHTDSTKQKISKSRIGFKYSKETKQKMSKAASKPKTTSFINKIRKPVLQFTKQGKFIKEWESSKHAAITMYGYYNDNIGRCCRGELKIARGFIWKWK